MAVKVGKKKRKATRIAEQQVDESGHATRLSLSRAGRNPIQSQADLIELQDRDFETRFQPLEEDLRNEISRSGEFEARRAGESAAAGGALTAEQFMRDLGRSGTQLTERQAGQIGRSRGLAQAKQVANAKNTSRQITRDTNLEAQAQLIGIGRDVSAAGGKDLASAAQLQTQRENANRAADSAQDAQTTSMVATGLGLAAAFFL